MLVRFGEDYVNPSHISALWKETYQNGKDKSLIYYTHIFVGSEPVLRVKGTPEEVIAKIREELRKPDTEKIYIGDIAEELQDLVIELRGINGKLPFGYRS